MNSKNIRLVLASLLLTAMLLAGCSKPAEEGKTKENTVEVKSEQNTVQGIENTRRIICPSGEEVVLPPADEINRVIMTSVPLPSTYRLIEDDLSKLVGINPGAKVDAENSILSKMAPEILEVSDSFMKGSEVNVEELLKLKPDVVFYYGGFSKQGELYDELGINAVDTRPQKRGDALEMMMIWVKVIGEVFENEKDIKEIIDYGTEIIGQIEEKTSQIEDDKKVKALTLFRLSEKEITVSGKGNQGDSWLQLTGAVNMAADIKGTTNADMEQIYKWNPEIIYVFDNAMPEDLINNTIKGQDWSKVKAVQNGRVYKIPVGIARWFPPSGDAPLMLKWMAQKNYPKLFDYYNMEEEIKSYYKKYYKYDIADDDIHRILNPVREKSIKRGQGKNF